MPVLDKFRLDGKIALVTGGGGGLGQTMATALAEAGADVVLTGRTLATCRHVAKSIAAATGRTVHAFAADVSKAQDVDRLFADVTAACGGLDILINNAGTNVRTPLDGVTESDWDSIIDTNLKGPFLCTKAFAPGMLKKGWGRVINIASIMSVVALPTRTSYCASKAGVLGLTRVWALEWAGKGVTCNAICPGPFATELTRELVNDPATYRELVSTVPMGRWGELEELAGAALFLASDASSFVTGSSVFVDGGCTAR